MDRRRYMHLDEEEEVCCRRRWRKNFVSLSLSLSSFSFWCCFYFLSIILSLSISLLKFFFIIIISSCFLALSNFFSPLSYLSWEMRMQVVYLNWLIVCCRSCVGTISSSIYWVRTFLSLWPINMIHLKSIFCIWLFIHH